ncbi:MAG: tetratricopeptide repeat protein [Lachnospiraceae bacterium]
MGKKSRKYMFFCVLTLFLMNGCGNSEVQTYLSQGIEAIEALEYQKALEYLEEGFEESKDKREAARLLGIANLGLTNYNDAIEYFLEALSYSNWQIDSIDYDLNYYLAASYFKNEEPTKAKEVYSSILSLKKNETNAYFYRGIMLLEEENLKEAILDFETAMKLEPNNYNLVCSIFKELKQYGYEEEGAVYLQGVIEREDKGFSQYELGRFSYYLKDYDSARVYLEQARETGNEEVILMLGKTYEALGDFNYASSVYQNYLSNHDSAIIYNQLGLSKLLEQNYEQALEAFKNGLALNDSSMMQILKYNEMVAYEFLGDFETAKTLMKSFLTLYPNYDFALRENEFLASR